MKREKEWFEVGEREKNQRVREKQKEIARSGEGERRCSGDRLAAARTPASASARWARLRGGGRQRGAVEAASAGWRQWRPATGREQRRQRGCWTAAAQQRGGGARREQRRSAWTEEAASAMAAAGLLDGGGAQGARSSSGAYERWPATPARAEMAAPAVARRRRRRRRRDGDVGSAAATARKITRWRCRADRRRESTNVDDAIEGHMML
ncbi:hypothetical protein Syun_017460 [Stephania yunnanensis]|uniref:Uncharacterized protein n=1 Tax=Stephania yunnanensis TaxID=152371 RepID=A0AAP0P329_9MAGN